MPKEELFSNKQIDTKRILTKLKESEEKFRRLFEAAQDAILILNAKTGEIEASNPYLQKILGYTQKELIGKQIWQISPFKNIIENKKKFAELQKNKYVHYENLPLETKTGQIKQVEFVSNEYMVSGKPIIQCNIRDITDRKIIENKLKERENALNNAQQLSRLGNWNYDLSTGKITWSRELYELTGYDPRLPAPNFSKLKQFYTPENWAKLQNAIKNAIKTGKEYELELETIRVSGEKWWQIARGKAIKGANGKIIQLTGTVQDITEQRKNQHRLEESELRFRSAFENSNVGISIVGLNGQWLKINKKMCEIVGYSQKELIEHKFKTITYKDDIEKSVSLAKKMIKNKIQKAQLEKRYIHKTGKIIWVLLSITLVLNDKKEPQYFLTITEDITQTKKTMLDLKKTKENIEKQIQERTKKLKESEEKYRQLIETLQEGVWAIDEKNKTSYVNRPMAKMLGYTQKEMMGKPVFYFMDKRGIALANYYLKRRRMGIKEQHEFEFIRKDGKRIFTQLETAPIKNEKGKFIGALAGVIDITKRKNAEEKYRQLYNSSNDAIMTLEPPAWKFTSGNPATIKMFNVKDETQFTRLGPWDLSPKKQPDGQFSKVKAKKMIEIAMKTGKNFFEWTHARYKDGDFPATVLLSKIIRDNKTYLQATVRDNSEQKRLENEQKRLEKSKATIFLNTSHELKTPITPITLQAEMLKNQELGPLTNKQKESLEIILNNMERLNNLISDVLDVSRINAGAIVINKTDENLKTIAKEEISKYTPLANQKGIKLTLKSKDIFVKCDAQRLKQVFTNLLSNALKFTPKGKISITIKKRKQYIVVKVKDTGIGISKENIKKLFIPFFQVRSSYELHEKGTGLGLSIVKSLVEQHGGKIWIKSKGKNKGSTFYFTIPLNDNTRGKNYEKNTSGR